MEVVPVGILAVVPWNPWRALRELPDVTFKLTTIDPPKVGLLVERDGHIEIHVDRRLRRRSRRAVLAHELVHLERGPVAARDVARDELAVDREVARRLVPPVELAVFIAARASFGEHVTVHDVAEEFDVPRWVARHAVTLPGRALDIRGL